MLIDLSSLSTPQLYEMRSIIKNGAKAVAEVAVETVTDNTVTSPIVVNTVVPTTVEPVKVETQVVSDVEPKKIDVVDDKVDALTKQLETATKQLETVIKELSDVKLERDKLLEYKKEVERKDAETNLIASRQKIVDDKELEIDVNSEAKKWLAMNDEQFLFAIEQLSEIKKLTIASQGKLKIPAITGEKPVDHISKVRDGLRSMKKN